MAAVRYIILFLALTVLLVQSVKAEAHYDAMISEGMTFAEVVRLLGAPSEKVERETKRENIWKYSDREVFFQEGRVVSVKLSEAAAAAAVGDPLDDDLSTYSDQELDENVAVEEILSEIMRVAPQEEDSKQDRRSRASRADKRRPFKPMPLEIEE